MTYMAMFQKAPGVIESIMLVKYLGHNCYILSLADPFWSREEDFKKNK